MITCLACGWDITLDFGRWKDATGNVECSKNKDHAPRYGK